MIIKLYHVLLHFVIQCFLMKVTLGKNVRIFYKFIWFITPLGWELNTCWHQTNFGSILGGFPFIIKKVTNDLPNFNLLLTEGAVHSFEERETRK